MSRARVAALALVNWKGVFYERYLLDRHVTALEGANGAGKTTVMIAAYVVLLPDMSKLRFTNLGESGATGGDRGIWGRLGEPGRPSYAALDLELGDGARVVAGVRLTRAAEPTVEPTAFLIEGLGPNVRLADVLLVRRDDGDHVPELDELRASVVAAGGTLEVFRATKDYFAALFDRGVTPMRLSTDEERSKLNEMLRTSMTGGISRALTSELRGFLLKEETGLGDTLGRMRANLDACRRTRAEVAESRTLEREISAIYEAGVAMFAAAVHAARAASAEASAEAAAARTAIDTAERARRAAEEQAQDLGRRDAYLEHRVTEARRTVERASRARDRQAAADAIAARLEEIERELSVLAQTDDEARAAHAAATAERAARVARRDAARVAYDRAAAGLANHQDGLDELTRRAHAHRHLGQQLALARELLGRATLEAAEATAALLETERALEAADQAHASWAREARDVAARRGEHATALAALMEIEAGLGEATEPVELDDTLPLDDAGASREVSADDPFARARTALARLAALDARVASTDDLERARRDAEAAAERQVAARAAAVELGLAVGVEGAAAGVADRLEAVEAELRALDDELRGGGDAEARLASVRTRAAALAEREARWRIATAALERLGAIREAAPALAELAQVRSGNAPAIAIAAALAALRDQFIEQQIAVTASRAGALAAREQLAHEVADLESAGGAIAPALLELRDLVGGELLASRFEDVDVDAAAWIEARLGPLTQAIIVEDPAAAAIAIRERSSGLDTVWLVAAGTALDLAPPDDPRHDAICPEPHGLRVTRPSPRPTLGSLSRARRAADLRTAIAARAAELDELAGRGHRLAAARRDAEIALVHAEAIALGDPADEGALLASEQATLEMAEATRRRRVTAGNARIQTLGRERDRLRRLLGEAALLEPPDHAARAAALAAAHAAARTDRDRRRALRAARAALVDRLEALRHPPPTDDALAIAAARQDAMAAQRDRLFRGKAALVEVIAHQHAAAWADAAATLDAGAAVAPALVQQHEDAKAAIHAADAAVADGDAQWEVATTALHAAAAARAAAVAHRDRARAELTAVAGELDLRAPDLDAANEALDAVEAEAKALVASRALADERASRAARAVSEAKTLAEERGRAAGPVDAIWASLRARADAAGLLHPVLAGRAPERTHVQLTADAWSKRELLLDRVARTRGGDELVNAIKDLPLDGSGYLDAWQAARDWLRRRVPAQIAEVDDPLVALERLRDHLALLESRLARQEGDLRGASEDVARGIDVQLRRAGGQVRRLNQHLEGIRFGSIHGIRVELRRVERMEQILRALRQGEAQELLFLSAIPIEEALDEIFKRYGGGRGGGARLLDYREYLELVVEIRRQANETWEPASPTRLSTGEAIGVGAALMMVVLTEWERDANLLRARRTSGSLRFLFLDEANRLSRDNLGTLFDLCRTLDLQLLIAAPEVARAHGNTTYRLVRHVTEDGREEVIVSGRRAAPEPEVAPVAEAEAVAGSVAESVSEPVAGSEAVAGSVAEAEPASEAEPEPVSEPGSEAESAPEAVSEPEAPTPTSLTLHRPSYDDDDEDSDPDS